MKEGFIMKTKDKILNILLSVIILMQTLMVTAFADEKELTWTLEPVEYEISSAKYESDYPLKNIVFKDTKTQKYGIIDKNGNIIKDAQLEFNTILYYYGDEYFHVHSDKGYAIYNTQGEITINFDEYDYLSKFNDSAIIAKKGD